MGGKIPNVQLDLQLLEQARSEVVPALLAAVEAMRAHQNEAMRLGRPEYAYIPPELARLTTSTILNLRSEEP